MVEQRSLFVESTNRNSIKNNRVINFKGTKLTVTPVYDTFWKFSYERQKIFFNRLANSKFPWTDDPILRQFKFTNAYRAADRVSQYLIKNVIYCKNYSLADTFFRVLLFKIFNKIETWNLLEKNIGEITLKNYNYDVFNKILDNEMLNNRSIYSAAYIMPSAKIDKSLKRKHSNHLKLIEMMINENAHISVSKVKSLEDVYKTLISFPLIGSFLAFQFAIDLNYSEVTNFSENEFVVPGPGALNGVKKCFVNTGGLNPTEIIKMMTEIQAKEFDRLNLDFQDLWGRPLKLIDIQNIFCEVDKYSRVAHPDIRGLNDRKRIKQNYKISSKEKIEYFFPPKWRINSKVDKFVQST